MEAQESLASHYRSVRIERVYRLVKAIGESSEHSPEDLPAGPSGRVGPELVVLVGQVTGSDHKEAMGQAQMWLEILHDISVTAN